MNLLTNPDGFAGLCNGHFLTKGHHACKTWDATADGYCRADGIVSLVIKRLEDAKADNDRVLATILATGTNHSANAVSITHPHAGHQSDLAKSLLREAAVDPFDVSYIELHGTGTQAGDFEEMSGVLNVYAPAKRRRGKHQPLHLGAVKANFGHGESAAGTTSLLKVLVMLQKNAIPRHVGVKTEINPRFPKDFDKRNVHIAFEQAPWLPAVDRKRVAVVNSFGAAGGNTTMILEEAPSVTTPSTDPRDTHTVLVSAKTKDSLAKNIERLVEYLEEHPDTDLASLSYTTTARRYQHTFRTAVTACNVKTVAAALSARLKETNSLKPITKSSPPPVAFVFTGQGASHATMNLELYHSAPVFREQIQHLDRIAQGQGFPSFIPALDGSHPKDHVHAPVVTQMALVCTEMALATYWASLGVKPSIAVGHSLGEYAAMQVAGVLSANDTVFLVGRRALMLQEKCEAGSHAMLAVRAPVAQISDTLLNTHIDIACINGPSETVLSGPKDEVNNVTEKLTARGYRCIKLPVAFAFHSEQTEPILDDFEAIAKSGVSFREPKMPVISPLLRKVVYDSKSFNASYVRNATRMTVDFLAAMEAARTVSAIDEQTVWIELGPHAVCTNFVKASVPTSKLAVPSMRRDESNWKTITNALASLHTAGVDVSWAAYHAPFEQNLRLLDLPSYAFTEKNHWLQYNGDWCLTKGNDFYKTISAPTKPKINNPIQTSTVQELVEDRVDGDSATVSMRSDLMQSGFLSAANGHRMNDCGVVTSVIFTLPRLDVQFADLSDSLSTRTLLTPWRATCIATFIPTPHLLTWTLPILWSRRVL
jgi:monodictyphenone polyketide synthase